MGWSSMADEMEKKVSIWDDGKHQHGGNVEACLEKLR